uniref:Uncharacterized protein n=1 Tax=viral metagenome TaxID=1070528 RepID=A0A6C0BA86_9ZZZZ
MAEVRDISIVPPLDDAYHLFATQVMATQFRETGTMRVMTRSITSPIACKTSAIIYVIICILIGQGKIKPPNSELYIEDTDITRHTLDAIRGDSIIGKLINDNKINPRELRLVYDISTEYLDSKQLFFMVLLNVSETGKSFDRGGIGNISHYFVIVQREGNFFLISSYGSSFCIPQKEVELKIKDWEYFVRVFTNPDKEVKKNSKQMIKLLHKYFLPLGYDVKLNKPDEDDVVYESIEEAIQSDVDFYIEHEHQIVSIDNIVELILPYVRMPVESSEPGDMRESREYSQERGSFGGKNKKTRKKKRKYTRKAKH